METPNINTIPLKGLRGAISRLFVKVWSEVPQVTIMSEADVTEFQKLRDSVISAAGNSANVRITYTHILMKAIARALKEHPVVNSVVIDDEVRIMPDVNICLVVLREDDINLGPVIHNVDTRPVTTIAVETNEKVARARDSSFSKEDFAGGTFALSNIGMFGVSGMVTPLIIQPMSAILLTGPIEKKPIVRNDEVVIRSMMSCSLTFDHRAMTAAPPSRFLQTLAGILENPTEIDLGL